MGGLCSKVAQRVGITLFQNWSAWCSDFLSTIGLELLFIDCCLLLPTSCHFSIFPPCFCLVFLRSCPLFLPSPPLPPMPSLPLLFIFLSPSIFPSPLPLTFPPLPLPFTPPPLPHPLISPLLPLPFLPPPLPLPPSAGAVWCGSLQSTQATPST